MNISSHKLHTGIFYLLILMGFIKSLLMIDPDFGWHLQAGKYIDAYGIPQTDQFSYTMPSYLFIDHEWLTNLLLAKVYESTSYFFLAIIFTFLIFLLVNYLIKNIIPTKDKYWELAQVLLLGILINFLAVRTQVLSWIYITFALTILLNNKFYKYILLYPLLILIWTNTHGSFPIGLVVLFLAIAGDALQTKKLNSKLTVIFILSVLITLLNPFGINIWFEIWQQMTDNKLKWFISEWKPTLFSNIMLSVIIIPLSATLGIKFRKKYSFRIWATYTALFIFGLTSARHFPFWVILSCSLLPSSLEQLELISTPKKFKKAYNFLYLLVSIVALLQASILLKQALYFSQNAYPSDEAVKQLQKISGDNNYFTSYNWGGYLLWKFPEKKVFIDGRMPSWRRSIENTPRGELSYAFQSYKNLQSNPQLRKEIFDNFNINTIFWPKKRKSRALESSLSNLLSLPENNFFIEELTNDGWSQIYEDSTAVIYQRNTLNK